MVAAMASICAFRAVSPAALGSLPATNSVIVSSKFFRALTIASSPCSSWSVASMTCLSFPEAAASF